MVASAVARINREPSSAETAVGVTREDELQAAGRESFQALVMQALQLRRIYREVFILCDIKGYSHAETAGILGITEESVGRRLRSARGQLNRNDPALSAE